MLGTTALPALRAALKVTGRELPCAAHTLYRIEAACLPENVASRRVLEKANFVREGYARLYLRIADDWRDHLTFALLKEDFDAKPEG